MVASGGHSSENELTIRIMPGILRATIPVDSRRCDPLLRVVLADSAHGCPRLRVVATELSTQGIVRVSRSGSWLWRGRNGRREGI